jgi:hypothetical protein
MKVTKIKEQTLLTRNNTKTMKGEKLGYRTYILYMSPYKFNAKGKNVCSHASQGCADSCLVGSGFGGMYTAVKEGRLKKTEWFLKDKISFLNKLRTEIEKAILLNDKANAKSEEQTILTFRLNGTSDLPYENFRLFEGDKNIFELFPDVQFYDYTKNYNRFKRELPKNYHLTFSRSETNDIKAMEILNKGFNVAMVFDKLPTTYRGFEVINGDVDDLRFLDSDNCIVGLKYKKMTGKGANNSLAFESGFAISTK